MLQLKKNVLKRDRYDELMFKENLSSSERIMEFAQEQKEYKPVWELIKDTFNAFYKYLPKFEDERLVEPLYRLNKAILEKAMKTQKYEELRRVTRLDAVNSAVATIAFLEALAELIEEFKEKQDEIENLQNQINQEKDQNKKQELQKQLQQAINRAKRSVKMKAIQMALEQAKQDAGDMEEAMAGLLWGNDPSSFSKVSPEERLKLAKLLLKNRNLIKMAKLIGKMKHLAITTYKSKVRRVPSETYETGIGDDLARLLPHEYVKLIDPDLEIVFYKNLVEKQLQQYKLGEKTEREKGDFVVCIDLSGSMWGEPEMWAKAVALATLEIAIREKRGWTIIPFDYHVHHDYIRHFDRKNRPTPIDIIEIAEMNFGGGTNFEEPLRVAMETIKEAREGDILFITDGICGMSDEFLKQFKEWK